MGYSGPNRIGQLQRILAVAAIALIRVYQMTISRLHSRNCLFCPSCSHQAIHYFRQFGFWQGLAATRNRLKECTGTYSLRLAADNSVEMITESGRVVVDAEINLIIKSRLLAFDPMSIISPETDA